MREPEIRIGFVIFREGLEAEVKTPKGHWWAARNWVKERKLEKEYERVCKEGIIKDYDDFLTDYIGAIKLHAVAGVLKCYIPRGMPNQYKSFLKRLYRSKGYKVYGDVVLDEDHRLIEQHSNYALYNQTVITTIVNGEKKYMYHPLRDGD